MSSPLSHFSVRGHDAALIHLHSLLVATPPHALLLIGPTGVGVGRLAREVAMALLCAGPSDVAPCHECRACRLVAHESHTDLHLLSPAGPGDEIGVDPVRELAGAIALLPVEGRRRVALIARADRMSESAQHALLKLLEEPPAGTHLLLAASDESRLLPTIKSRCATLRLGLPEHAAAVALLVERLAVERAVATRLLAIGEGRPGPLLQANATAETAVTHATLRAELLDLTRVPPLARLTRLAPLVARAVALLAVEPLLATNAVSSDGQKPRGSAADRRAAAATLLRLWRSLARDLATVAAGAAEAISFPDERAALEATVAATPVGAPAVALARIDRAVRSLRANPNPELLLDTVALTWLTAGPREQLTAAGHTPEIVT